MNREPDSLSPTGPSEADATSLSLLFRLKANDATAWDRLVVLYAPLIHYWCRKLYLPDQDTADVFQEVFQAVAAKITTFRKERPGDTFRGWLRTITQNKVLDHFRRQGREPQAAGGTEANIRFMQVEALEDAEAQESEERAYQQLIQRALELIRSEFTPRTWQAFWRVAVDGQRAVDVAEELEMRPGAVRVAKSRVLQRLRQELGELGA
ncbi:MAG: sigma-70 family RNA polymerase sigma factor [Planctomycetota bacterium]|jgi:RNA polymerase sigma-70 factor (ECF subfamily)